MTTAIEKVGNVAIDYAAVLNTLKLNPKDPNVQALLLVCQSYELDPVLKHMILIQGAAYVTHKGLWHIAHRSGLLDGHEIIEEGETDREYFARVAIYRKDWSRPVTMRGRYPRTGTNKQYGQEMAVTRAECLVLRRLFDVALPVYEEINWSDNDRGVGASHRKEDGADNRAKQDAGAGVPSPTPQQQTMPERRALEGPQVIDVPDNRGALSEPKQRSFPAPGAQKNQDEFTSADETLCTPAELKVLHAEIDALDLDAAAELAEAWKAAGLPSVKNKRSYDRAAYEQAMGLVLDAKERQAEREAAQSEPVDLFEQEDQEAGVA